MALLADTPEAACVDRLIDQLAEYGVTYITGGHGADGQMTTHGWSHEHDPASTVRLFADLSDAPVVRVADAMIALLLRHPELALYARQVLSGKC